MKNLPEAPQVGDLWSLAWGGDGSGLVVISSVGDGHVVGWPVTLDRSSAIWPAVRVRSGQLGREVTVWPQAATGLGNHLLHENLGSVMSKVQVAATRSATRSGEPAPFPYEPVATDEHREAVVADLLELYTSLCFDVPAEAETSQRGREPGAGCSPD